MDDSATASEARLEKLRAELLQTGLERRSVQEREQALQREIAELQRQQQLREGVDSLPRPLPQGAAPDEAERDAKPEPLQSTVSQAASTASTAATVDEIAVDRFIQGWAARKLLPGAFWVPHLLEGEAQRSLQDVFEQFQQLPVTLFCGRDAASRAIEECLRQRFADSARVRFKVRHFCHNEDCSLDAVCREEVALLCLNCSGDEGQADTLQGKALARDFLYAYKGWVSERPGRSHPSAAAVFGHGDMDCYRVLYRNTRGDSDAIFEALEGLGSTMLLRKRYVNEASEDAVVAAATKWSDEVFCQVENWSRGCCVPEEEVLHGPEWTLEEIQRADFVLNRRGMQDG
eukprot:TRINITY_DN82429_c0_g1_i1.p1 TRINITY_DN82429_c0_g1~~TRINITY_DN82429_c0_g1_i1.p1  ORF type:complete len:367 (+),score=86.14 TRINITY_DN82429_c0_g1_i1:66-1103(+)